MSTSRLRIVSSSTFKRGFSNTKVKQVIDTGGNVELIVNTPIISAFANTGWGVWLGILTLTAMVSLEVAVAGSDILNAVFVDAIPDLFDVEIPLDEQADVERYYPDDGDWPSTPNVVDNLNTSPSLVNTLSTTIRTQTYHLSGYIRSYIEPLLENAAVQIRSGNFNLDPNSYEHRALLQLLRNLDYHEENLRLFVIRLQDIINRIEPGSLLWENHPELHLNFRGLHGVAVAGVVELNNLRSRSILFGEEVRGNLAQQNRRGR